MSAFIIVRLPNMVRLYTDGGLYRSKADFTVTGQDSKVTILPHISTVITAIGTGNMRPLLHFHFGSGWESYDHLLECIQGQIDQICNDRWLNGHPSAGVFGLAGWSVERNRFETHTLEYNQDEVKPPTPAQQFCYCPNADAEQIQKVGLDGDAISLNEENCDSIALKFMQAQRATPALMGREGDNADECPSGHYVGCFMQSTTLLREAVVSQIIHRWPDVVGRQIDISNDPPLEVTAEPKPSTD